MGSLFQLRDFWSTSFAGEEYSASSMCVGNIDNSSSMGPSVPMKIAVGSFQGRLRVLEPSSERGKIGPDDILVEKQFDEPILQVSCGPYEPVPQVSEVHNLLAVLFPQRLLLLRVQRSGASGGGGSATREGCMEGGGGGLSFFYDCETVFEAHLDSPAYNFTSGPFGGTSYHMICVQSMDGRLTILDSAKVVLRRMIPANQFLLPGSLAYVPKTDSFLTCNSSLFLMCYSFTALTNCNEVTAAMPPMPGGGLTSPTSDAHGGKQLSPNWAFNLGEEAVAIHVCRLTRGIGHDDVDIVVLCPYQIYILSVYGKCRITKRLDVEASCSAIYHLPAINADNLLVGNFNGAVNVYTEVSLEWSAKMPSGSPMTLAVGNFCGVQSMIAAVDSEGKISVNYLGTDTADNPVAPLESQTAQYSDMARELRRLQSEIQTVSQDDAAVPTAMRNKLKKEAPQEMGASPPPADDAAEPALQLPAPIPTDPNSRRPSVMSSAPPLPSDSILSADFNIVASPSGDSPDNSVVVTLSLRVAPSVPEELEDVVVQLQTTDPLAVAPPSYTFPSVAPGRETLMSATVTATPDRDSIIPSSLVLYAVILYKGVRGEQRTVSTSIILPLCLVARPVPPVKNTAFSLQLNTDKSPPPSLLDVFSDMATFSNVSGNVMSVSYVNGCDATVLVSKNAARFKLHGSTMEGLWLLTSELERRLTQLYSDSGDGTAPPSLFSIPDAMPFADFFAVVDTHLRVRQAHAAAAAELSNSADFFRAVVKRHMLRFRERNPTNSVSMNKLLHISYAQVQENTDTLLKACSRMRQADAMLNACARFFFLMLRIQNGDFMAKYPEDMALLESVFQCDIDEHGNAGWEEMTEATLRHVLDIKTGRVTANTLEMPRNTTNVKKYVEELVKRVVDGRPILAGHKDAS